jgi:hypothetical protein
MADNTVRGRFVWHELYTPNKAGAHEFYTKTLPWKVQGWEQDPSYTMFTAASGPLGASVESRDGAPRWLPYIGALDVDATVESAQRLGATVVQPATTLPNAGRYAVLKDPDGAEFGVHGSPTAPAPEKPAQIGEFHWHELATNVEPEEAFEFYRELFGWDEIRRHDMGPAGIYFLFGRNGTQRGGIFKKGEAGKPGPAYWVSYVRVANVDQTVGKAKAARAAVLNGPMDVPGGDRIAQLGDPHGAIVAVVHLAADAKAAKPAKPEKSADKAAAKPQEGSKKQAKKKARKKTQKKGKKAAKKIAKKAGKKRGKKAAKTTTKRAAKKKPKRSTAKRRGKRR